MTTKDEAPVAVANRSARANQAVVERAQRFVSTYLPPQHRPIPRPIPRLQPELPTTREAFIGVYGEGLPPLTLSRHDRTEYLASGATMGTDGMSMWFRGPAPVEQDRLLAQIGYVKRAWFLTEQQLLSVRTAQRDCGSSSSLGYQLARLPWNADLFGPAPMNDDGQLDFEAAIKQLTGDIDVWRNRFTSIRDQLHQLNPNLIVEARFLNF